MNIDFRLPETEIPRHLSTVFGDNPFDRPIMQPAAIDGWVQLPDQTRCLMMSSYSYLGLIGHPDINAAANEAVSSYGTGVHGSRLVTGTLDLHKTLEKRIADFSHQEDAILFSSGYVANLATISALASANDTIYCDVLSHASIKDGCRMSGAETIYFAHNNVDDLRRKLERSRSSGNRLVVLDAVYSMEGDISRLPEILETAEQHNALVIADEAHSLGVVGTNGRGIEEHFGLPPGSLHVKMGTLSKTVPSIGGYIASSKEIVGFLKHKARGYIFSSAVPGPAIAAALAAFDIIERESWRTARLQQNAKLLKSILKDAEVNTLNSETAIIPALCGDSETALRASQACLERKIVAMPITFPAVQKHAARLRLIPCANHAADDVEHAGVVVVEVLKALKLLRN